MLKYFSSVKNIFNSAFLPVSGIFHLFSQLLCIDFSVHALIFFEKACHGMFTFRSDFVKMLLSDVKDALILSFNCVSMFPLA